MKLIRDAQARNIRACAGQQGGSTTRGWIRIRIGGTNALQFLAPFILPKDVELIKMRNLICIQMKVKLCLHEGMRSTREMDSCHVASQITHY